ncbi:MAG: 4'-phosphopantetheinyl transferase superfamily protein [Candidatus Parcubacteria bacterium]|uniref:4'-phosphopantetheinyl transferase family protein n=1 Tax=Phormidesmis priestleyi TaxID=268141 RepID=UPI00083AB305|nr:4'-phosphopantetheinyl transferase superfamily protein [Phormidesmis priestleyi]MBC7825883.1 4'-phosphopantetheinyl transferase superfamily protein [Leptolyngbyaceae cyanobacterium LF-bin-113]
MKNQSDWMRPPTNLRLQNDEVHVWRSTLDLPTESIECFAKLLSSDEQIRADRFRFVQHRQRFVAGRGVLRSILGQYLQIEPDRVQFLYSEKGKPFLADQSLQFNVAHSQGLALYAIALDHSVGVDLEHIRAIADLDSLTQRFFTSNEHAAIAALPINQQSRTFFRYWACKEAYLKATGDGLAKLQELEISLSSKQACLKKIPQGNIADWNLRELDLAEDYVGAIVTSHQHRNLIFWRL